MRTVAYRVLEEQVARRMRWDPSNLDAEQFATIRDAISSAIEEAWRFRWWPEILVTSQRRFAAAYDEAATYAAGAKVYHVGSDDYYVALKAAPTNPPATLSGATWSLNAAEWGLWRRAYSGSQWESTRAYTVGQIVTYAEDRQAYQCHTATTAGDLPTDTDHWGELPLMVPTVPYVEAGFDSIGDVEGVYRQNPDVYPGAARMPHRMVTDGVAVFAPITNQPWIRYLPQFPALTGDAWVTTESYGPETDPTEDTEMPLTGYNGVAQLRAKTTYVDREMAYIFYIATATDGGAGWFRFDASSAAADDNNTHIRPTNNPLPALGCWIRVS